jgi:hypothetical protein
MVRALSGAFHAFSNTDSFWGVGRVRSAQFGLSVGPIVGLIDCLHARERERDRRGQGWMKVGSYIVDDFSANGDSAI